MAMASGGVWPALACVLTAHLAIDKDTNWAETVPLQSALVRTLSYAALVICIVTLGATDSAPFIYFQF